MKIRRFGPFRAVGAHVRTSHDIEGNDETGMISKLRIRFHNEYLGGLIRCRLDRCEFLEIFTDYETDHRGVLTFIKGHRVSHIVDVPDGMIAIEVPRRRYAVFTVNPDEDENFLKTEQSIRHFFEETSRYQRAFTTDLILSDGLMCKFYVSIK